VIRDQNYPLRKTILDPPVGQLANLPAYTFISGNIDSGCCPPLRHGEDEKCHGFLSVSHVTVVRVAVDDVEGKADILGYSDAGGRFRCPSGDARTEEVDDGLHETARADICSEEEHSDDAGTGRGLGYGSAS